MLETEYFRAVIEAELRWLNTVLAGLRDGSITWDNETRAAAARLED